MTARPAVLALLLLLPAAAAAQEDPAATRVIPPYYVPPALKGQTYQRVLVFGDWGTGTRDQRAVAAAMVKKVATLPHKKVDFLLTTGDNFYPRGVKSVDDPNWKSKFESVYAHPLLQRPVWATLGNHDHAGNVQAQIDYSKQSKRWRMPAAHYTFTKPVGKPLTVKEKAAGKRSAYVEFFCIDSDKIGGWLASPKKQLKWLEARLAASKATWKVVVGHHPMYSHSKRPYNIPMISRLEPLFTKHKVDLYLAGHDHVLELTKPIKGVHYVVSGAGGGPRKAYKARWTAKSHYAATRGGFVMLRIGRHDLVIEFVRMNGKTQFAHTLYKKRIGPF